MGLAEKVKKFQLQIESLNAEKEDLVEEKERINAQLFFFMNKLQECETVLLEFMQKERTLRQQAASDNEVISYLDLQVQQLEGELHDARQRSSALQASLDLQMGTHSVKVRPICCRSLGRCCSDRILCFVGGATAGGAERIQVQI